MFRDKKKEEPKQPKAPVYARVDLTKREFVKSFPHTVEAAQQVPAAIAELSMNLCEARQRYVLDLITEIIGHEPIYSEVISQMRVIDQHSENSGTVRHYFWNNVYLVSESSSEPVPAFINEAYNIEATVKFFYDLRPAKQLFNMTPKATPEEIEELTYRSMQTLFNI